MLCAEGNLEDDLGNSEAAAAILRRAATLFEGTAETFLWAKTLARLAYTLVDLDPAESLRIVEQAAELIPLGNPRLVWSTEVIRINGLIVYLLGFHLRRGQKAEALAVCRRART
ncbi:MAG TPA: hypothetical protein DD490_31675, partial [Acidobacteria bacterium]|nr:hypothetical protein [Acidobacteriota bacterium]